MMAKVVHVEVTQSLESKLKTSDLLGAIREELEKLKDPVKDFSPHILNQSSLKGEVVSIKFSYGSTTVRSVSFFDKGNPIIRDETNFEDYQNHEGAEMQYHFFKMNTVSELIDEEDKELTLLYQHWICPCEEFDKLWDSLQFPSDVKAKLLEYVCSVFRLSEGFVDETLVSLNKMVLIYGAPGTGKTSLCKAIAHKSAVRLGGKFDYGQLIQLNLQSCLPGSTAEGGCASTKVVEKLQELVEDKKSLVFVLIDDVDHFARRRSMNSPESSESARSLHFLVNQLERLRRLPNVIVLATSSMVESLDPALTDRADMKFYLEIPSVALIYKILSSSINELLRSGFITSQDNSSLPNASKNRDRNHPLWEEVHLLQYISDLCTGFSARMLRKIAFLTYVKNAENHGCTLVDFLKIMKRCVLAEKTQMDLLYDRYLSGSKQARKVVLPAVPITEKIHLPDPSPPKPSTADQTTQTLSPEMVSSETFVHESDFQNSTTDLLCPSQGLICVNSNNSTLSTICLAMEVEEKVEDSNQDLAKASVDLPSEDHVPNTEVTKSESHSNLESSSNKCVSDTETDVVCEEKELQLTSNVNTSGAIPNYTRNSKSLNIRECSVVLKRNWIPPDVLKKLLGDSVHRASSIKLTQTLMKQLSKEITVERIQTVGLHDKHSSVKLSLQSVKSSKDTANNIVDETIKNPIIGTSASIHPNHYLEDACCKAEGDLAGIKSGITYTLAQDVAMPTHGPKDKNSNMITAGAKSITPKREEESGGKLKTDPGSSGKFVAPVSRESLSPSASDLVLRAAKPRSTATMEANRTMSQVLPTLPHMSQQRTVNEKLLKLPSFIDSNRQNVTEGRPGPQSYKDKFQSIDQSGGILRRAKTYTEEEPEVITVPDDNTDEVVNKKAKLSHSQGSTNSITKSAVTKVNQMAPTLRQVYITDSMGKTTTVLQPMKKKMFDCDECDFSFLFKRDFNKHKSSAHRPPNENRCEHCQKQFASADSLRRHSNYCRSKKQACLETNSVSKEAVKTEKGISTGVRAQQSPVKLLNRESKAAITFSPLTTDLKQITMLGCEECDKYFNNVKDLERHKIFHQDERPFKCAKCPKTFKSESSLNFHIKLDHGQTQEFMYPCSICGFLCASESHVDEHERAHHDSQNYVSGNLSSESTPAPDTPCSLTTTEQSSNVSSVNNSSDYEQAVQGEPQLSGSRISQDFNARAQLSVEPMEFPIDESYQSCSICGECLLGKQELLQHNQIYHLASSVAEEIGSTCNTDFFSESSHVIVPVPEVEQIIEVETTDQFLEFLSAF